MGRRGGGEAGLSWRCRRVGWQRGEVGGRTAGASGTRWREVRRCADGSRAAVEAGA